MCTDQGHDDPRMKRVNHLITDRRLSYIWEFNKKETFCLIQ